MSDESTSTSKQSKNLWRKLSAVLFLACVVALGASVTFYKKYQAAQDGGAAVQASLVEKVGQSVVLPDEKPTIVTVADKQKLSNRVLAARVENKDVLLIFGEAKRLVVYRPSSEKIVDMLTFSNKQELPEGNAGGQ